MFMGWPGMEGSRKDPYNAYTFDHAGKIGVYARYLRPAVEAIIPVRHSLAAAGRHPLLPVPEQIAKAVREGRHTQEHALAPCQAEMIETKIRL